MKNKFIGYYNPTEEEINNAWENGIFAFDTNSLLNLYRYTELTRNDFLSCLKTIKGKIFLPYQSALEFHSNRNSVIESIGNSYAILLNIFENNFENILKSQLNQFKKHPSIVIDIIFKLQKDFIENISEELEKQKQSHPNFKFDDTVLKEVSDLFENSTGDDFSKEDLIKIYSEGKNRYAENIPPGYKDLENKKKKGDRHIYGDLIIWKELINFSKKQNRPLIFVTDDRKEDWWTIENGKTLRPREELIKEFHELTGIRILIYNADHFLQFAKKKFIPQLKDQTIEEVKEIRISDENTYSVINEFLNDNNLANSALDNINYNTYKTSLGDLMNAGSSITITKSTLDLINAGSRISIPKSTLDLINAGSRISIPKSTLDLMNAGSSITIPKSTLDLISAGSSITIPKSITDLVKDNTVVTSIDKANLKRDKKGKATTKKKSKK